VEEWKSQTTFVPNVPLGYCFPKLGKLKEARLDTICYGAIIKLCHEDPRGRDTIALEWQSEYESINRLAKQALGGDLKALIEVLDLLWKHGRVSIARYTAYSSIPVRYEPSV